MDKDLIISVLAENVQLIETLTMTSADDTESDVETFSYLRGALSAYLIVKEAIEDGQFDTDDESAFEQLMFGV